MSQIKDIQSGEEEKQPLISAEIMCMERRS
jgi:hypothetical protein